MLTGDRIKPYLLHEDRHLRTAATHYFYEGWSRDPALVPDILAGCERFGFADNVSALSSCWRFPLTDSAFQRVLGLLAETDDGNTVMHLSSMIARAPIELLRAHEARVFENEHLLTDYRPRIQHRLSVAGWHGARLWDELQAFSRRSESAQHAGDIDHVYADALVEALARYDIPDAETVCRLLTDQDIEGQWLEIFLIDLAGERRVAEAIPALVERFHVDTDYMLDQCVQALAKLGDPAAVRLIREAYPGATWNFKNYTASLLGDIKQPESEEAIIALLETERSVDIRTDLCLSLCNLFSERGVEIVQAQIRAGYDELMVTLEEVLLPVAQVLGIDLPEAERWRQERDERDRVQTARRAELESLGPPWAPKSLGGESPSRFGGAAELETEKLAPFRRHDPKVGRNAPCPCGSGKKFKRCCGKE